MNCWEYKNCPEEVFRSCPAYPDSGSVCYTIIGIKCSDSRTECSSLDEQIAHCSKCGFYSQIRARCEKCEVV